MNTYTYKFVLFMADIIDVDLLILFWTFIHLVIPMLALYKVIFYLLKDIGKKSFSCFKDLKKKSCLYPRVLWH